MLKIILILYFLYDKMKYRKIKLKKHLIKKKEGNCILNAVTFSKSNYLIYAFLEA